MVILTGSLLSVFWQANTVLSITLLVLLCSAAHGVNLMLITHVPKRFKRYGNISAISGCLNACTYVGSAISTYGVALLVERRGWQFTIGSWVVIGALGLIACAIAIRPWWKFFRLNSNNQ
jgi:OPA family glycerol-3-phosphate transporter-like MFS transporter